MKLNFFIILLSSIALLLACDDENTNDDSAPSAGTSSAGTESQELDMELPVQQMDFDTMEIEVTEDMAGADTDLD